MSQITLRITVFEYESTMSITLEGRVAGPWVAELSRIWVETALQLKSRNLVVDLRNVTYADGAGIDALRAIYSQSRAKLLAASPWTEYLAREISKPRSQGLNEEVVNASRA